MLPLPPKVLTERNDPLHLIKTRLDTHGRPATIQGPMVRYSKLAFRETCREYNVDITYTPMMLAREFVRNEHARLTDLSIGSADVPVIAQVGVNSVVDLMRFVEMVSPYVDGIGINCGCPIREQVREGIGCALIYTENLLVEMVKTVKDKYGDKLRLETKIRIHEHKVPERTLKLCRRLCDAGVDWITVHGRLRTTRSSEPVDLDAIKYIVDGIADRDTPVVANGDCFTVEDMVRIQRITGAHGVMAARGLLANPALFSGQDKCPWGCLERFLYHCSEVGDGLPIQLILHHVHCMLESMQVRKKLLKQIMNLESFAHLLDWLEKHFVLLREGDEGYGTGTEVPLRE
ncbi:tRNA dihydrouridine synthase KNAG_0B06220 [Huiozyma naganishii CBS 8797]|uniref:tRNA-dihydrouridine synthase n=1 Tax=Huiozyma naganishii (strain ATCC MYA-139 / BCRC 22969 / CBS 8797 / KCTC 17520 / NBRC 10181 / NCYC 3082 / Yp74L-3) TaxID=1071383 RepID=J7RVT3_HUIN7|nr:hypothetical protein KNAG_0B06220 [Kazachstania naganishii CBS 8797]CCK69052.1 hypothetical protein KNAG_0B06220 [Kazachstania naganishii CBS 8797]